LAFPHEVKSVFEAYRLLSAWPGGNNPAQSAALNACRAALAGEVDVDTARSVFEAFTRRSGVLMPEVAFVGATKNLRQRTIQ